MRRNPRFFRLTATVALTALLWDAVLPVTAMAQPAPPPLPPAPGQPTRNQDDPPARVGRIAAITGTVSFHNQGDTQWSPASVNYPVSSGNAFWTEPSAETQLEVSDSRIALAGGTEFDIYALDGTGLQGVAVQGESYFHLRDLAPNEAWSVQTPRGLVRLGGEGRYEIAVGSTDQPTLITVIDGSAQIEGPNVSLQVAAGQTATITGTDSFQGSIGPALRDGFLTERLNAERPVSPPTGVPAQVAVMPGGSDLYGQGSWSPAPDYGQVWYPPVQQGWVPYRQGHWAYVAPWGWTWIDDAAWGFAPFHYGRWVEIGGRWAWSPGGAAVSESPVYAPALVAFIGIGAGVALGAALASGSIGWVPLGPREEYHPWYRASPQYVRQININHVTNISNVTNNNVVINNYINRGAATSVPAAAMTGSRPIQAVARPVTPQEFAQAHAIVGQQPLRPSAATLGITPVVARQLSLAPAAAPRSAPGPAVRVQAPGSAGGAFARPALVPAGRPAQAGAAPQSIPAVAPNQAESFRPGAPGAPGVVPGARPVPGVAPNRPGVPTPGGQTVPGAVPNAVTTSHPGAPVPGGRPVQAVTPNATTPVHPAAPVPGVAPNALQPNRAPAGRPPGEPQIGHPEGLSAGGLPPAAIARPAPPHPTPVPAPAPVPAVMPRRAPQAEPAPRPEPHIVAPAPVHQFAAPPQPAARPAPPPQPRPAPAAHEEREKKPGER